MKMFAFLFFLLFSLTSYGQNRDIDYNDPIGDVDVIYTADGITRLVVVLNTIDASNTTNLSDVNNFTVTVQGQILWANNQSDAKKTVLQKRRLDFIGNDRPFVMFTDLYDGSNNLLKKSGSANDWSKLSLRITYAAPGKSGRTPTMNFHAPMEKIVLEKKIVTIDQTAIKKDGRRGILTLRTNQKGTPFELTQLKITKKSGQTETTAELGIKELGDERFCFDGELQLYIITSFDLDLLNTRYSVSCTVVGTSDSKPIYETTPTDVTFVPDPDLRIKNLQQSHTIIVPPGVDVLTLNLDTDGNGKLGVKFLNAEYAGKLGASKISQISEGKWQISLEGLSRIPSETSSTFYYLDGSKEISPPLIISKKLPRVSDFKFNGLKGDSLALSFRLSGIDKGLDPRISISGDKGKLDVGGKIVVKRRKILTEMDKDMFDVIIDRNLTGIISSEAATKDITFSINYGGNSLYDFTATTFNQKLFDSKKEALEVETAKRPSDRDKAAVGKLVKDLVAMGKAIGNPIEDEEVAAAIDGLQKAKGAEVKKVFSDIGKWALIAGKVILPLI